MDSVCLCKSHSYIAKLLCVECHFFISYTIIFTTKFDYISHIWREYLIAARLQIQQGPLC